MTQKTKIAAARKKAVQIKRGNLTYKIQILRPEIGPGKSKP